MTPWVQEWEDALIKHKVMDAPLDHAKMKFMLEMKREAPPACAHPACPPSL